MDMDIVHIEIGKHHYVCLRYKNALLGKIGADWYHGPGTYLSIAELGERFRFLKDAQAYMKTLQSRYKEGGKSNEALKLKFDKKQMINIGKSLTNKPKIVSLNPQIDLNQDNTDELESDE